MDTIRIGVASKDGFNVNEHFGKAQGFLIYDYNAGKLHFVEERLTEPYSVGDPNHSFDKERFDRISDLISICLLENDNEKNQSYIPYMCDMPFGALLLPVYDQFLRWEKGNGNHSQNLCQWE